MKIIFLQMMIVVVALSSSCSHANGVKRELETAIEKSLNKFHTQLNNEQYSEIYAQADQSLHARISEANFTSELVKARTEAGNFKDDKAIVILDDSFWRGVRSAVGYKREHVKRKEFIGCDAGSSIENFEWVVEGSQAKLVHYQLEKAGKFILVFQSPSPKQ